MLECLERYDGETGQFWTYADYRVTGHILDRIRKETHSRNVKQYTYLPIEDSPDLQHELVYKHDFPLFCDMQNMILPKLDRTKDILEAAILCGNLRKAAKVYGVTESRVCQITSEFKRNNSDVFS
jgi:DNA-directed RNA polymerase specialized sigma subunit